MAYEVAHLVVGVNGPVQTDLLAVSGPNTELVITGPCSSKSS